MKKFTSDFFISLTFLIACIVIAIYSIFTTNSNFINAVNILSIGILLITIFLTVIKSISLLLVKIDEKEKVLSETRNNYFNLSDKYKDLGEDLKTQLDNGNNESSLIAQKYLEKVTKNMDDLLKTINELFVFTANYSIYKKKLSISNNVISIVTAILAAICLVFLIVGSQFNLPSVNLVCVNILSLAVLLFDYLTLNYLINAIMKKIIKKCERTK